MAVILRYVGNFIGGASNPLLSEVVFPGQTVAVDPSKTCPMTGKPIVDALIESDEFVVVSGLCRWRDPGTDHRCCDDAEEHCNGYCLRHWTQVQRNRREKGEKA